MGKINLAVIGANSMVGSRFCELSAENFNLIEADYNSDISIDITSENSVKDFFKENEFDYVILFSAFTDVDAAENQRNDKNGSCWMINVDGVKNVTELCKKTNKNLIILSTDFVFDGTSGPYSESDLVGPDIEKVSWYGITKIESEKLVSNLENHTILRISYPFRGRFKDKEDIAKRILRMAQSDNLYPMFSDQIITPTFIDDLEKTVPIIIKNKNQNIVHLTSPITTTQFEFAKELLATFGQKPQKVVEGSLVSFLNEKKGAPRPVFGGLKTDKIESLGFIPTDWKAGIKKIFDQSQGQLLQ